MVDIDTLMEFLEKEYPATKKWQFAIIRKLLTVKPNVKPYEGGETVTRMNHIPGDKEVVLNYGFYKNPKGDIIEPLFEEPYYEYCFKERDYMEAYTHMIYLFDRMPNAEKITINILVIDDPIRQNIIYDYIIIYLASNCTGKGFNVIEDKNKIILVKQRRNI